MPGIAPWISIPSTQCPLLQALTRWRMGTTWPLDCLWDSFVKWSGSRFLVRYMEILDLWRRYFWNYDEIWRQPIFLDSHMTNMKGDLINNPPYTYMSNWATNGIFNINDMWNTSSLQLNSLQFVPKKEGKRKQHVEWAQPKVKLPSKRNTHHKMKHGLPPPPPDLN